MLDCSKAPDKYHKDCQGLGGGQFSSTASGSPNIHPGDWMPFELRTGTVWVGADEEGTLLVSFDEGRSVSATIDGAKDFEDIRFGDEIMTEEGGTLSSVQVFLTDREGNTYAGGQVGMMGQYDGEESAKR